MKLKRGKSVYKVGPFGLWHSFIVDCGALHYPVIHAHRELFEREKSKNPNILGFPILYCVDSAMNKFEVYPKPDKSYSVSVRYYPPMVEK